MSLPDTDILRRRVVILGSTGSIGTQTLDVIAHANRLADEGLSSHRFEVVGLAARSRATDLARQASRFGVPMLALADPETPIETQARVIRGADAPEQLVRDMKPDLVVAAMVGIAGLPATLASIELGIDVALANKETLVGAGQVVVPLAARTGARLLPVDSEHSALWQCLQGLGKPGERTAPPCATPRHVERAILTASGGPFRKTPAERMRGATVEEALAHPTWSMGRKNTIDSATLINKGLELIEARWLFDLDADRLSVLVHPQSIVHAIVEQADGSAIAQLASPDMRLPIQLAMTWPARTPGCIAKLDWREIGRLEFHEPDHDRFPAVNLAMEVIRRGGSAGVSFNASNEIAVEAFLGGSISFGRITEIVQRVVADAPDSDAASLEAVFDADGAARDAARDLL